MSEVAVAAPAAPSAPPPQPTADPAASAPQAPAQNTAEQAPAAAPEGDKPDTDQNPEKKRESRRFERRLDKAYKRAAEAEARAQLYEKQLSEARAAQQAPADPNAPQLAQFDDIEKYAAAKAQYEANKALKDHTSKQQEQARKQQEAQLVSRWEEAVENAEDKYEDFRQVVGEIKPTTPWAVGLMNLENGADVAYHLGKNMKEAQRIDSLPPVLQLIEVGRLAAKLAAEPPKAATPSKAPAPITPLKGTAPVSTDVPSTDDSMKDWMRKRNKQVAAARK